MSAREILSIALLAVGGFFFFAGTIGLLRFPDLYTRLHALTKADNLGLGFVVFGLAASATALRTVLELGLIWALVLASSCISSQLIARYALEHGIQPWRHE